MLTIVPIFRMSASASPPRLVCTTNDHEQQTSTVDTEPEGGESPPGLEDGGGLLDDPAVVDNDSPVFRELSARLRDCGEGDIPRHLQPLQLETKSSGGGGGGAETRPSETRAASTGYVWHQEPGRKLLH